MQFSYDARPSFWQKVKSNSHLVIAAVGTAALLSVAGVALWLAMPAGDRQAFADSDQSADVEPGADSGQSGGGSQKAPDAEPPKVTAAQSADATQAGEPRAARRADEVSPATAAEEASVPVLPASDPRWTDSQASLVPSPEEAAKQAAVAEGGPPIPTAKPGEANAFAPQADTADGGDAAADVSPDSSATAAIPAVKPKDAVRQTAGIGDDDQGDESATAAPAATGRILRTVTMRSGPKQSASVVINAIPAKTAVQVLSCSRWCQIVYNGKRGWIYKSFLQRGG